MNSTSYKIILIGSGSVGKTTYVKHLLTGDFTKQYVPTHGVEVHSLNSRNIGVCEKRNLTFNVWDCAGQAQLGGLRDGYFIQANAAIIMFDMTNRLSIKEIASWFRNFRRICPDAPVVIVGNKADIKVSEKKRKFVEGAIQAFREAAEEDISFCKISAKSNFNSDEPFNVLADKLGYRTK